MHTGVWRRIALGSVLAVLSVWPVAVHAQPLEPTPLSIEIDDPALFVDVETLGAEQRLVLRCYRSCTRRLPQGKYRLTEREHTGDSGFSTRILLSSPVSYRTDPPNLGLRYLGATVAIVGAIGLASGFAGLLYSFFSSAGCLHQSDCDRHHEYGNYGLVAAPIGGVLLGIGIPLVLTNLHAFTREELDDSPVRVGLLPSLNGASGVLSATF